ncbi:MAG TPA: glucose-1-phosphate adenylyltransferase, partial [Tenacibaculum sp.]|nr:glucose-1-phosphate adenylyltransferase [Tenacibaculum sp.]
KIGVGDNCIVENVIIDKDARIGNNVVIKGGKHLEDKDEQSYVVKEGIVVIKREAIIEDGFILQ